MLPWCTTAAVYVRVLILYFQFTGQFCETPLEADKSTPEVADVLNKATPDVRTDSNGKVTNYNVAKCNVIINTLRMLVLRKGW